MPDVQRIVSPAPSRGTPSTPKGTSIPASQSTPVPPTLSGKPKVYVVELDDGTKRYCFHCPACSYGHQFDSRWTFSGTLECPTFRPSLRLHGGNGCHLNLTAGMIYYHTDSKHGLAGKTVECPDAEE